MGCSNSRVANDLNKGQRPMSSMSAKNGMSSKDSHRFSLNLKASDEDGAVSIKTLTFRHVMKDPLGREFFMVFLKMEHAEENLIFFEV